jgi:hypothetical protein
VCRRLDEIITRTVSGVRKAVKWNSPLYGLEEPGPTRPAADTVGTWFLSLHCFEKYLKVAFFRGTSLRPVPPGESTQKEVRYLNLREADTLDEDRLAEWIRQASRLPGERM